MFFGEVGKQRHAEGIDDRDRQKRASDDRDDFVNGLRTHKKSAPGHDDKQVDPLDDDGQNGRFEDGDPSLPPADGKTCDKTRRENGKRTADGGRSALSQTVDASDKSGKSADNRTSQQTCDDRADRAEVEDETVDIDPSEYSVDRKSPSQSDRPYFIGEGRSPGDELFEHLRLCEDEENDHDHEHSFD